MTLYSPAQKRSKTAIFSTNTKFLGKKQFLTHVTIGYCSMMN